MNVLGVAILLPILYTTFFASRRWALIGMMAGVFFLSEGQQINVLGLNIFSFRIIEVVGFLRVVRRGEFSFAAKFNRIDRALVLLYVYTTVVFLIRSEDSQVYQIGLAVDAFLCYFTFRGLMRDVADLKWFLRSLLLLLGPFVALLLVESVSQRNPFSILSGDDFVWLRDGRTRCIGSFRNPSLLGTVGASFVPLYIGLWFVRTERRTAVLGVGLCMLIVWASNSGGPVNCVAVGVIGWMLWLVRTKMKLVRRGLVLFVLVMSQIMKSPIWYLPAKASSVSGGDGYHRSYLMDMAFQNIDKWWLAGMPLQLTRHWFPYVIEGLLGTDITNQFIVFGFAAGLLSMFLFIGLLVQAYRSLGQCLALTFPPLQEYIGSKYMLWSLGVVVTVHIVNWLGIPYFDQTYVIWFLQLATISSLCETLMQPVYIVSDDNIETTEIHLGSTAPRESHT